MSPPPSAPAPGLPARAAAAAGGGRGPGRHRRHGHAASHGAQRAAQEGLHTATQRWYVFTNTISCMYNGLV